MPKRLAPRAPPDPPTGPGTNAGFSVEPRPVSVYTPVVRIIFMGTAELSCQSLRRLAETRDFKVAAVVTQPDRPKGRDLRLQPSLVKVLAQGLGLPVLQPERARSEGFLRELQEFEPDLIVVVAYGQILPKALLDLPKFGCLNVHTSLLPKYRGAAPIQWAVMNGDPETGVTIMKMDEGLDTGPILTQETIRISPADTSETMHQHLALTGADLLVRTIPGYLKGEIQPHAQPTEDVSYAPKIRKQDGKIDWAQPARTIWNRVRGLVPWPGAFTHFTGTSPGRLLKIWQALPTEGSGRPGEVLRADKQGIVVACGHDALSVRSLQVEGGRKLAARDFLSGHPLKPGDLLG